MHKLDNVCIVFPFCFRPYLKGELKVISFGGGRRGEDNPEDIYF